MYVDHVTIEIGNAKRIVILEIFKPGVCLSQSENHFNYVVPLCVCMCVFTDPRCHKITSGMI